MSVYLGSVNGTSERKMLRKTLKQKAPSRTDHTVDNLKRQVDELKTRSVSQEHVASILANTQAALTSMQDRHDIEVNQLRSQLKQSQLQSASIATQSSQQTHSRVDAVSTQVGLLDQKMEEMKKEQEKTLLSHIETLNAKIEDLTANSNMSMDMLKQSMDMKVGASQHSHDAERGKREELASMIDILKSKVDTFHAELKKLRHNEIADLRMKVNAMPTANGYLHVGEPYNMPEQPAPKKVGGVHQVAPLAMAINGGLVLGDIGYTDKKGHILTLNPDTRRIEVYIGK